MGYPSWRAPASAGGSPDALTLGRAAASETPTSLRIRVPDRDTAKAAGIDGAMFTVERAGGKADRAAASGEGGDYSKTSLAPTSSWAVGEQGADFSYT